MDYPKTLDFLYTQLPMYQRIGAAAYKTDLNNTIEICRLLGNPERRFASIHIAGTNGKGSVAHMLASVFQEAGFKTGLYTSPHLVDFRERIKINGEMIPEGEVVSFVQRNAELLGHVQPSFFEYTFGMAMDYFSASSIDMAIIETGMGGRLDSTNVITPMISVITNIGMDHNRFLGDKLEKIALEKAGIIKPRVPVVIGETQVETEKIFRDVAREKLSEICFADQEFSVVNIDRPDDGLHGVTLDVMKGEQGVYRSLDLPFGSDYQLKNTLTVVATVELARKAGHSISTTAFHNGISNVISNTGFAGRWQVLRKNPLAICDTGHNRDGIRQVVDQINALDFRHLHFVFGTVDDKDIDEILGLLSPDATYYFCKADIPRAMDAGSLKSLAGRHGLVGKAYPSVKKAYEAALEGAGENDLVFVGGSTFVVAEIL